MAKNTSGLIKVTDPKGTVHIVPEDNRRQIEIMNQFEKGERKYKVQDYDPSKPDLEPEAEVGFTDLVGKLSNENADLKKQNELMMKRLEALEKGSAKEEKPESEFAKRMKEAKEKKAENQK